MTKYFCTTIPLAYISEPTVTYPYLIIYRIFACAYKREDTVYLCCYCCCLLSSSVSHYGFVLKVITLVAIAPANCRLPRIFASLSCCLICGYVHRRK